MGLKFSDTYRTLPEARLIDGLLLEGYAFASDSAAARADAAAAIDRWVAGGLPVRQEAGVRLFDPVEVAHHAKLAGLREEDDFWHGRFVATLRRFVTELAAEQPRQVSLSLRRTFNLSGIAEGETRRLRMPLPLAERYADCTVRPELTPAIESHRLSDGRLEARVRVGDEPLVSLGATVELTPARSANDQTPPGEALLRPREGLIVLSDAVAALARRLAGNERGAVAVRNFWDHLIDSCMFCPVHYDQVPAETPLDWVLERGIYDCQLAAALFVGLCRAVGIPARMVGGNFLYRRSPTNHYWAEAWLEDTGWQSFDFLVWDLSAGGRDPRWRDHFFGQVDARIVTEVLPANFTGAVGVQIPAQWFVLRTITGDGAAIELTGLDGASVYQDTIAIR